MNLIHQLSVTASSLGGAPTEDAAREIGPGFAGFVATAAMVIVVIFLIRDMARRIRRVRYTGEAEQRQADLVERGRAAAGDDEALPERNRPAGGVGDPGTPGRDRPEPR